MGSAKRFAQNITFVVVKLTRLGYSFQYDPSQIKGARSNEFVFSELPCGCFGRFFGHLGNRRRRSGPGRSASFEPWQRSHPDMASADSAYEWKRCHSHLARPDSAHQWQRRCEYPHLAGSHSAHQRQCGRKYSNLAGSHSAHERVSLRCLTLCYTDPAYHSLRAGQGERLWVRIRFSGSLVWRRKSW